jgi:hypothetical protein
MDATDKSMRTADDRRHKRAGQWVEVVEEPSLPRHEGRIFKYRMICITNIPSVSYGTFRTMWEGSHGRDRQDPDSPCHSTRLSITSHVVLGIIALRGPSTSYDLKRAVSHSVGYWEGSHGRDRQDPDSPCHSTAHRNARLLGGSCIWGLEDLFWPDHRRHARMCSRPVEVDLANLGMSMRTAPCHSTAHRNARLLGGSCIWVEA